MITSNILLLGMPGGWEWAIVILGVILLFGGKKIPELARGLGKGIREFKDATKEVKNEIEEGEKSVKKDQSSQD